jgi:hypothetical protein
MGRRVNTLNLENDMRIWNVLARNVQWPNSESPLVTLTVRPPGNVLTDVHGCIMCLESVSTPTAWSLVPRSHSHSILPHDCIDDRRTLFWNDAEYLVSTLTPFPATCDVTSGVDLTPDRQAIVYDHIMLENRRVGEYLDEEPGNHLILYDVQGIPCTMTREQIRSSKVYVPCRTINIADHLEVDVQHKAIVGLSTACGTFYVPREQLVDGQVFQLVPTKIHWDCSVMLVQSDEDRADVQEYVGGFSSNGGPWSHKMIHYLRHLT